MCELLHTPEDYHHSLFPWLSQGHATSVMHNRFMTKGAFVRLFTNIPLRHDYLGLCVIFNTHPDLAVSLPDPSCLLSAAFTLDPLHRCLYMLCFCTETFSIPVDD